MIRNQGIWYVGYRMPTSGSTGMVGLSSQPSDGDPPGLTGIVSFSSREEADAYCRRNTNPYLVGPYRQFG